MSKLLGGVISELVLILLNLDFEINRSSMKIERFINDIHIPTRTKYFSTKNLLFMLSFVKGCVQLSFICFKNDLLPTLFASLTQKYWRVYLHSGICIHR
jgi:hypothetical protein